MKVALVNPPWSFHGSIYFGCREPHLPLEYGYAKALLEHAGHDVLLADAQLGFIWRTGAAAEMSADRTGFDDDALRSALQSFAPDLTAITTAPSYLFWRCAPPELRVPIQTVNAIREVAGRIVAVGPHASTTPTATLKKLGADIAILGECEDVLVRLAQAAVEDWHSVGATATLHASSGQKNATDLATLPALSWPAAVLARHHHHHHRFDRAPEGAGAEIEATRGCPYHCTFCAKDNFRDGFRKRPLATVLEELDLMIEGGVRYVYFIDEIFVPDRKLLEALATREIEFGVQMRIDNWTPPMLELLGRAGCVSIEAGVESITDRGRSLLAKHCKASTEQLTQLLLTAKEHVPFVQANLINASTDQKEHVAAFRARLKKHGVWSNDPVPLFAYPGSPEYTLRFGACDEEAWERAHAQYLTEFVAFSEIQAELPLPLAALEGRHA